jgi:hypothetical protein
LADCWGFERICFDNCCPILVEENYPVGSGVCEGEIQTRRTEAFHAQSIRDAEHVRHAAEFWASYVVVTDVKLAG